MFADAKTVVQELLDTQSRALMTADAELMCDTVLFPYRRATASVDTIIENLDDLRIGVNAFHQSICGMGVNHLIRLVISAEYLSADYIEGRYITHLLRNASAMLPAYENSIVLRFAKGAWRVIEIRSELGGNRWPISLLRVKGARLPPTFVATDDDIRRTASEPMPLYQGFLDRLSAATMTNDFDDYLGLCDLPYTSHSDSVDTVINTADHVRAFFDTTVAMISGDTADTLKRVADNAQFLGPDLICGYHDTLFSKDGAPTLAPIKSRMILKRRGVEWKLKHVTNAVANPSFPYTAPEPTNALLTHREIQERTKTWPTLH